MRDSVHHILTRLLMVKINGHDNNIFLSGSSSKADFNIGESFEPSYVYKMLLVIQSSLSAKASLEVLL